MRSTFSEDQHSVGILSGKVSRGCRFRSRSELMAPIWSSFKKYHHILFQNFFNADVPSLAMKPLQSYAGTQWKGFSQRFSVSRHCFCFPKFLLKKMFYKCPFSYRCRGNLRMYRLMSNKKTAFSPRPPPNWKIQDEQICLNMSRGASSLLETATHDAIFWFTPLIHTSAFIFHVDTV